MRPLLGRWFTLGRDVGDPGPGASQVFDVVCPRQRHLGSIGILVGTGAGLLTGTGVIIGVAGQPGPSRTREGRGRGLRLRVPAAKITCTC